MGGGEEPAGLMGADRPAPGCSVHRPFSFAPCAHIHPHSLLLLDRRNKVGPAALTCGQKFSFECIFSEIKHALVKNKNAYAEMK